MGELRITLPNGITLPLAQALRIGELSQKLGDAEWHVNDCGCCVTVHPKGQHDRGYVIGEDGNYDWHQLAE